MNLGGPVGEVRGEGASPLKFNYCTSDFDEIWAIYVNLHEKNNEIGQNSLDIHVRGVGGL